MRTRLRFNCNEDYRFQGRTVLGGPAAPAYRAGISHQLSILFGTDLECRMTMTTPTQLQFRHSLRPLNVFSFCGQPVAEPPLPSRRGRRRQANRSKEGGGMESRSGPTQLTAPTEAIGCILLTEGENEMGTPVESLQFFAAEAFRANRGKMRHGLMWLVVAVVAVMPAFGGIV